MLFNQTDFLIIGGGIIGISISLEIKKRFPDSRIVLIEKEKKTGQHASGRNSGVLHAGFYYTVDSYKARLTREGNKSLTDYCIERKLPVNQCGKLVVASTPEELTGLHELLRRGKVNGVELELISEDEARRIEPRVRTFEQALFSPKTSTIDPSLVNQAMYEDAIHAGINISTDTRFISERNNQVRTNRGKISAGYIVNAGGLQADYIAHKFGFAHDYTILPFKGLYLYSDKNIDTFHCNIYPVPDINNPFLGVHLTVDVQGRTKIGPTAVPAFWRENYSGLEKFSMQELIGIVGLESKLFLSNESGFRKLAVNELGKIRKKTLVSMASRLVHGIDQEAFTQWGKPGIRAQLFNTKNRKLEMDFCFEGDEKSFHVLNAVSPAYTCAIPFSKLVVDRIAEKLGGNQTTP